MHVVLCALFYNFLCGFMFLIFIKKIMVYVTKTAACRCGLVDQKAVSWKVAYATLQWKTFEKCTGKSAR